LPFTHVLQVIGYLLQHPVAALVAGGGAAFLIPRLVRFGFRFVVIPGALILVAWLAINNPSSAWTAASGLFSGMSTLQTERTTLIFCTTGCLIVGVFLLMMDVKCMF
jgi:hypothetical protein